MNWMIQTLWSSIGKKLLMALTGLAFCGFLAGHLAGNLTIYGGKDAFNSYAEHLHALGPVLTLMEWGLLVFAVVHVNGAFWFLPSCTSVLASPCFIKISERGPAAMPSTNGPAAEPLVRPRCPIPESCC